MMDAKDWDERYAESEFVWSVGPNQFVESICRGLAPGRMLDLAAGEGRNAVWFAENGWKALAVDYSTVAMDKAQDLAARRGVALSTVIADLIEYEPEVGRFNLVLISYLHLGPENLATVLSRAAAAVAPGGLFLLVGHDVTNIANGYGGPRDPLALTSPEEVVTQLGESFSVSRAEVVDRSVETDEGLRVAKDTVVLARRVDGS